MSAPVVVIGDAHLDVQVAPEGAVRRGSDVPSSIDLAPGGQGANVAVRLARLSVPVRLVAAIGPDSAGALVRATLASEGVALTAVDVEASGATVVLGELDGERTMFSHRTPFADRAAAQVPVDAAWLIVSGYLLDEPAAAPLARDLAERSARRVLLGCAVPDPHVPAWRSAAAALRADLWVGNEDELGSLGPIPAGAVAVTDAGGATISIGDVMVGSRAPTETPARDTTGAGDAFAAALVAELREAGWPPSRETLERAVQEAVALAARVARTLGAQARVAGERPAGAAR